MEKPQSCGDPLALDEQRALLSLLAFHIPCLVPTVPA